jgi:hypothetical protein
VESKKAARSSSGHIFTLFFPSESSCSVWCLGKVKYMKLEVMACVMSVEQQDV